MSNKKRTSITVDEDVFEFLSQSEINQSGLINELVKEYKDNKQRQVAALKLRYKHLLDEAEEHRGKAEKKTEKAGEVKELLEEAKEGQAEGLENAREAMSGLDESDLTEDNPAVKNWADKLGWDEATLLERL